MSEKRCLWLALAMIQGLGNIAIKRLLERFREPEMIFKASLAELCEVEGIREEIARSIVKKRYSGDPERELIKAEDQGVRIITYNDPEYPVLLREIHDPPVVLYIKGKDIPGNRTFIAVVGSRNSTSYGQKAAEKIGQGLARRGLGVVSGMARGIDSSSHWGCLEGKGITIAVLGTGIDVVYPTSNRRLYDQIAEKGVIISEFPMGSPPVPNNFPIRNRIISGLCRGTVIVEATKNSGSLITASLALEQGRELFAVPGSINSFKSTGCHYLIKQGACLIENADDILEALGMNYPSVPKTDTFREMMPEGMDDAESELYNIIGDYPVHIDQIARDGRMNPGEVSSLLMKMELKGLIRQLPGKMFVR
ncbi:MAG: DNA-processing protein DprA [Deltaproteobacteria bacterium]|nr:DNA-processing protein DprA [Deltaproteobacteria bacterium]